MKRLFNLALLLFCTVPFLEAQMPFQVQLVIDDELNTLSVNLRNVENAQPAMGQEITSINMRLLGQVSDILSIASTNYTMQEPTTTGPNTQVITMNSPNLPSPETWMVDQWVTVVVYNLTPGSYTNSSFSVQPDEDGDNSDVQDPVMSVAAVGVFNISLNIVSTILPIELASFSAHKVDKHEALLKWESEMEVDFYGFEIERSTEEQGDFRKVGTVEGAGAGNYTFNDRNPLPGNNYYRLKMIDLDGAYEFSPIRMVSFENEIRLTLYPNPSSDGRVSFAFQGMEQTNDLSLAVTSASGELVKSLYLNNVNSNTEYMTNTIDVPGAYFLRISLSNGHTFIEKLVISK